MRVLILRSRPAPARRGPPDPYAQEFRSHFADRVVGNLIGEAGFCSACGPDCNACRAGYDRRFGEYIAGQIALPAVLPYLLEDPGRYVPADVPAHQVLLAINVHEQVLLEVLRRCRDWGTRGVVVPVEAAGWVSGSARSQAEAICREAGVEVAFPKPFCAFAPPAGTLLAAFRRRFHVGRPDVELTVRAGRIERAYVHVSAACGATYYVARGLQGRRLDDDLKYDVVAKRLHSYPCTASMEWDDQIGDTIMHVAGEAHYAILAPLAAPPPAGPAMVMSPVGRMVLQPVPARENIKSIERAKGAILEELAQTGAAQLDELRRRRGITPAALSSAVLLLKQEGRVRVEGGDVYPARSDDSAHG